MFSKTREIKMKKLTLIILLAALIGCQQTVEKKTLELTTKMDKVSYSIGIDIGKSFENQPFDVLADDISQGMSDALTKAVARMTQEEMETTLKDFQTEMMSQRDTTNLTPPSNMENVSYSIGYDIGNSFGNQPFELVAEAVAQGLKDGVNSAEPMMTKEEMEETLTSFQEEIMNQQDSGRKDVADKNRKEGEEFLTANKTKEGIITTESGLQYKVIKEGTGRTPTKSDQVETHYRGTLIDGKEFDSSYKRGETITFPVSGVIAGWTEALLLMKEGAKWQLFIPSNLAYGPRGAGGDIGPNATLIFDIELVAVK